MGYGLGVDLGTTFTAAAVSGDAGTRMVPLGPDIVVPSTAFVLRDGGLLTGDAAELAGAAEPNRLSRSHKRRLGDPTPRVIGGVAYSPEALLAAQLRDVVRLVTAMEGTAPDSVMLTCPAVWGPYRREHFEEVPRLAGLSDVRMVTEPEAAAMHYSVERRIADGELVAVYDLGGGTFDATILRARPGGMEILGTPEGIERLGGIDFDEALLTHVDTRLDGAVSALDPADPQEAVALTAIRALCVRAKEDLSLEPDVTLDLPLPDGRRQIVVTRLEFNDMIRPAVALTTEALHRTISSAGLRPDDLAGVLLAGGSSRIPLVPQMVSAAFGKPVRVSLHPKYTVALGAAAIARSGADALRPADVSPEPALGAPPARGRPRWLLPVAGVAAALVAAATVALAYGGGQTPTVVGAAGSTSATATSQTSQTSQSTQSTQTAPIRPGLELFDGRDVGPYRSMIGSADNGWVGTPLGDDGEAENAAVAAVVDGTDGVRVTWSGAGPGQFYLQSITGVGSDLRPRASAAGALVMDVVVHEPPSTRTALATHCVFPCGAELESTSVFRGLEIGRRQTVKVPISCFTAAGLDPANVNTPFLIVTDGGFDATFSHIRWVDGAAADPDATPCDRLR